MISKDLVKCVGGYEWTMFGRKDAGEERGERSNVVTLMLR
jgi:hypothetical protein